MTSLLMTTKRSRRWVEQRGSALLVSLMVMAGLSLLGLAFVASSETEGAISINERNHTQTVAVAEAGAKVAVQWFQDPQWALAQGLMPANSTTIKNQRTVEGYVGYYKPNTGTELLCDRPYKPGPNDRFYGTENSPDVRIDTSNAPTFIQNLNSQLFPDEDAGEITDIRIYAPPIIGGTLVNDGGGNPFWVGGTRYGVATIRVVAEKFSPAGASVARGIVKMVVAEFPVPGPNGVLESGASIDTKGNFHVYWGTVTAQTTLDLSKNQTTIPWFDAYDRLHFEHGYDSSKEWVANTTYVIGDIVRPTAARITANPALRFHEYVVTTGGTSSGTEPAATGGGAWPLTGNITNGTAVFRERPQAAFQTKSVDVTNYDNHNWLYEIVDKTVQDPWFEVRSRGTISGAGSGPHPDDYAVPADSVANDSHHFQFQSFNQRPEYKEVIFPTFDYDFWKAVAVAGNGQKGVHFLSYDAGNWTDGVYTKGVRDWMTFEPGFYFFDTKNGLNPQNGGPGTVAPAVQINGGSANAQGFFYMNYAAFGTKGLGSSAGWYPQPGEVYRDVGYGQVNEATGPGGAQGDWFRDGSGNRVMVNAANGTWDFQDLAWSNTGGTSGGTKNGVFDVYVKQRSVKKESGGAAISPWLIVPYYPGCHPGSNAALGADSLACSEPHEPYLNLKYTGTTGDLVVGWQDPSTETRRPKRTSNNLRFGTPVTCSSGSSLVDCTSNAYDRDGGLVNLTIAVDGVLYIEGGYESTGNAEYFGAIICKDIADPKGTPTVYHDEALKKGSWPPPGIPLPRVFVTSIQTDQ